MLEVCRDTAEEFIPAWRSVEVMHLGETGAAECGASEVAEEVPIGFIYHGFSHAVMMATPRDLQDFALGFSLSEGFARDADDILATEARASEDGIALSITLAPAALRRFLTRRRARSLRGHTSCGICGVEELADVRQAGGRVCAGRPVSRRAVQAALASLREFQPLSRSTRGAHAAAWVDWDGRILLAREDVGRHNALDKLIGACLRERTDRDAGFCLITSRCSFEMVQKAIAAGMGTLVAVSAPTALAIRTAAAAGVALLTLDRAQGQFLYTEAARAPQATASMLQGAAP
jgi:FdhD protein